MTIRPTAQDINIGRQIFRNWCRDNSLSIDPVAASDLVQKIAETIAEAGPAPLWDALKGLKDWVEEGCPDGGRYALVEADAALKSIKTIKSEK